MGIQKSLLEKQTNNDNARWSQSALQKSVDTGYHSFALSLTDGVGSTAS